MDKNNSDPLSFAFKLTIADYRRMMYFNSFARQRRQTLFLGVAWVISLSIILLEKFAIIGELEEITHSCLLLVSAFVLLHNGNPIELVWGPGNPLQLAGSMLAAIPVYALWALPTVGWLLLCSAWSKSKPFLWAIMLPVFAGIFISWFDIMNVFNLESGWFWQNIVARGLLSAVPGTWFDVVDINNAHITSSEAARQIESIHQLLSLKTTYSVLLTPQLWIGALAGAVMIYAAIRLRRWRDEG